MRHEPIDSLLFVNNRKRLSEALPKGAIAIFNANDRMPTNADGVMPYRQNNDLFYLTGIDQENTMLVVCPHFPNEKWREVLFIQKPDAHLEKWEGHKLSKEEATTLSGINTVVWTGEFNAFLHQLMVHVDTESIFLNTNEHYRSEVKVETRDARFIDWCKTHYPLHHYCRVAPFMARLRTVKDERETALIQRACDITAKGFRRSLTFVRPGVKEYEVEAEYLYEFIRHGSRGFAYEPIIASGSNNCILHYGANNNTCRKGDLLLMDVGAEYACYNADLSRTIPVSGRFTPRQKAVYNATLHVMKAAMELMTQGLNFFEYQKQVEALMEQALLELKLITRKDIQQQHPQHPAFRAYFYHGVSHMLGLDVHDVGDMYTPMKVGSVWTVEPGIYIEKEGFGIRLENNVRIGKDKVHDMTQNIPIQADEIEDIMNP